MNHFVKLLGLLLLVLTAQHSAEIHELSHFSRMNPAALQAAPTTVAEENCALCATFAQVNTPAFSHAFHIPSFDRTARERPTQGRYTPIDAAVPQPRSRGPPSFS